MSFLYSMYSCEFKSLPEIKINTNEHIDYEWFTLDELSNLLLVPDLLDCLRNVVPYLKKPVQLELFPEFPEASLRSTLGQKAPIKNLEAQVLDDFFEYASTKEINNNRGNYYVSFGPPAAGKTTSFKEMLKTNASLEYIREKTILGRKSRLNYYLHSAFEKEINAYFFHFQTEVLWLRFLLTKNAPNNALIDESIYSTLAYSKTLYKLGLLTDKEYQTFYYQYLQCLSLLPLPKKIFYFDCPINMLLLRIQRRGRKHEQLYSRGYLESLCVSFEEVARELKKSCDIIKINTDHLSVKRIAEEYAP